MVSNVAVTNLRLQPLRPRWKTPGSLQVILPDEDFEYLIEQPHGIDIGSRHGLGTVRRTSFRQIEQRSQSFATTARRQGKEAHHQIDMYLVHGGIRGFQTWINLMVDGFCGFSIFALARQGKFHTVGLVGIYLSLLALVNLTALIQFGIRVYFHGCSPPCKSSV